MFLAACSTNPAEVMVKAQAPKAQCVDYGDVGGVSITRCILIDEKTKEEFQVVGAFSAKHPFQVWSLKTADQQKREAEAYAKAQADAEAKAKAEAGSGAGSGSAAKK